ncbi:hypothetical protein [Ruegeria atlantica]|uniref:hypothetical protein n=1 Tax=Ruegeria atlantica TaxID=81569 RepID=UPI00147DFB64|nr:hypothetical protein [Ruegeria atlantica]
MYGQLRVSWKFLKIAAIVVICVFPALAYYVMLKPPVFEARSLILFALGREYIYVPDSVGAGAKAPNPGDFQGVVNAEMLLLDNPELSFAALQAVGVERVYPEFPIEEAAMSQAVLWLQNSTTIELITGSYVVKIAVRHPDPEIAAELTNAISKAFLDRRRELYAAREVTRLETRLAAVMNQAAETNNKIAELLGGLDPQFITYDLDKTSEDQANLERLLRASRTTLAALKVRRDFYSNHLGMEDRLLITETEIQEERARIDYIERSMLENREKVAKLSEIIPILRPLTALQLQQADRIADLQTRLRDSLALSNANIEGNVRVIEEAVPPVRSSSPSLKVQLAIAGFASLLAGISIAGISMLLVGGGQAFSDRNQPEAPAKANVKPAKGRPIIGQLRTGDAKRKPKQRVPTQ